MSLFTIVTGTGHAWIGLTGSGGGRFGVCGVVGVLVPRSLATVERSRLFSAPSLRFPDSRCCPIAPPSASSITRKSTKNLAIVNISSEGWPLRAVKKRAVERTSRPPRCRYTPEPLPLPSTSTYEDGGRSRHIKPPSNLTDNSISIFVHAGRHLAPRFLKVLHEHLPSFLLWNNLPL